MKDIAQQAETRLAGDWLNRWLDKMPRLVTWAFCFATGIVYSWAFAPTNLAPLVFLVFPSLVLMVDGARSWRSAFGRGWAFGFGFFLAGLSWIGNSFSQQSAVPAELAPVAVFLMMAALALYAGAALALARRFWARGWLRVLVFTFFWVVMEYARSVLFTGFPWHITGTVWANWLSVLQSVAWLGTFGLTFVTVLMAASLVLIFESGKDHGNRVLPAIMFIVFAAMVAHGLIVLGRAENQFYEGINLRLVQANVAQKEKWVGSLIQDNFDRHMRLSRGSSADGMAEGVDVLIWPETSVQSQYFDRQGSVERWRLSRALQPGAYALTGVPRFEKQGDQVSYYNSIMAIDRDGDIAGLYDKHHLVPFGEYLPFQTVLNKLGLTSLTGSGFSAGPGPGTMHLPGLPPFSPTICYEAIFPGRILDEGDRPKWILNVTNDGWFGMSDGPYQHLALARMRAVEERMAVVRSAGTGISAVIDPYGRILRSLGLNRQGVLNSPLPKSLLIRKSAIVIKNYIFHVFVIILGLYILYRRKLLLQ